MPHYIIEKDGEQQVVQSLDGYAGCKVLGECDGPPQMWDKWDKKSKRFVRDEENCRKMHRKCKARDPEALLDMIESLTERVAALEAQIGSK